MGAQLSTLAPVSTVPIDAYIAELGDLVYQNDIGKSRFLKTVKATNKDGIAVVKVFVKPSTLPIDISRQIDEIKQQSRKLRFNLGTLNQFPNVIGYSKVVETDRAAYLVRQFVKHSLYDRISTRPFLEDLEKRWIAYQLLRALEACHATGIFHGDIKSENVLVGSWKWVFLTDFAPFKPKCIPETDTAQFLYYFDVSQRRSCYVAPERFSDNGVPELNSKVDVYSAGCVIAEMFMDQPLFSLADLFKYKRGEFVPTLLDVDPEVREMILSMVSLNPDDRLEAKEYLLKYRHTVFPEYFGTLWSLLVPHSSSVGSTNSNNMIEHLWQNFETEFLEKCVDATSRDVSPQSLSQVVINLPHGWWVPQRNEYPDNAALVLTSYVCSALTSTTTVEYRMKACKLLMALTEFLNDDAKIDRCLPYFLYLLRDQVSEVKSFALLCIVDLLGMVRTYSSLNARLYSAYLLPRLHQFITTKTKVKVKSCFALVFPKIAQHAVDHEGWDAVSKYIDHFVQMLVADPNSEVRRAMFSTADQLCLILDRKESVNMFLAHAITFLNDRDVVSSIELFKFLARAAPLVERTYVADFFLPIMLQYLYDSNEDLVAQILHTFCTITELKLVSVKQLALVLPKYLCLVLHPNMYIRINMLNLVALAAQMFCEAERYCILQPLIAPFLSYEVVDLANYSSLVEALSPFLARPIYSLGIKWSLEARNSGNSSFWEGQTSMSKDDKLWINRFKEIGLKASEVPKLDLFKNYWANLRISEPEPKPEALLNLDVQSRPDLVNVYEHGQPHFQSLSESFGDIKEYLDTKSPRLDDLIVGSGVFIGGNQIGTNLSSLWGAQSTNTYGEVVVDSLPNSPSSSFKSNSVMISSVKAHRGAINVLLVHENNRLFVTAADDGVLKLWDSRSLVKGTSMPLATVDLQQPITSAQFLGDSSVIAVGTIQGKLQFINFQFKSVEALSFDSASIVQELQLDEGYAQQLFTEYTDQTSTLTDLWILNSKCSIQKLNLRTLKFEFEIKLPKMFGAPTTWLWDPQNQWVLIGTIHGTLNLVDLRFRILNLSFGIGDLTPITSLHFHPLKRHWVCVAGGFNSGSVTVWDIQNQECKEAFQPNYQNEDLDLEPVNVHLMAKRFIDWDLNQNNAQMQIGGINCLVCMENDQYVFSGGSDRILRCWNVLSPHDSFVISGGHNLKLRYTAKVGPSLRLTFEQQKPDHQPHPTQSKFKSHNGAISHLKLMPMVDGRQMVISVDEVGVIKLFCN